MNADMKFVRHSIGYWHANGTIVKDGAGRQIADMASGYDSMDYEEAAANARVMAAGLDALMLLKRLSTVLSGPVTNDVAAVLRKAGAL